MNPGASFHLREIARRSGAGLGAVQRELARLSAAGLIERRRVGNQVFFSASRSHPLFPELHGLFVKTAGVTEVLRSALEPLRDRVRLAFLHGSCARGEEGPESDVDLIVIGDVSFADLAPVLRPVLERLGREVNPSVYPAAEFSEKIRRKHHFLTSVMRGSKVMLIGTEDELVAMAR